jgi:hypothetical protein
MVSRYPHHVSELKGGGGSLRGKQSTQGLV